MRKVYILVTVMVVMALAPNVARAVVFTGTALDDALHGTPLDDLLKGRGGNDFL